jgi:hypothetical protein
MPFLHTGPVPSPMSELNVEPIKNVLEDGVPYYSAALVKQLSWRGLDLPKGIKKGMFVVVASGDLGRTTGDGQTAKFPVLVWLIIEGLPCIGTGLLS